MISGLRSAARASERLHSSALWRGLKRVGFLRSGLYLCIELHRSFREPSTTKPVTIDRDFAEANDPWKYETSPLEQARFAAQTELLDQARNGKSFLAGVEIGCAEGRYTEILAGRCESLLVLDVSITALARTQARMEWSQAVRFGVFDLQHDEIPGTYDLLAATGVLEYFSRRRTLRRIREKLVGALRVGGFLLIESTRMQPVIEDSWWGRLLWRGRWLNQFVASHSSLEIVRTIEIESFSIMLCRKLA